MTKNASESTLIIHRLRATGLEKTAELDRQGHNQYNVRDDVRAVCPRIDRRSEGNRFQMGNIGELMLRTITPVFFLLAVAVMGIILLGRTTKGDTEFPYRKHRP